MAIRIVKTPPGEAPEPVRAAWVGLVLPVVISGSHSVGTIGVLSRPKSRLGLFFRRLFGKINKTDGYIVETCKAVEILEASAPEASAWWRKNTSQWKKPGNYFVFSADACEEVTSDGEPPRA